MRSVEKFMKMSISMLSLFQISKLENRIMLNTKHTMKYENFECSLLLIFFSTKHDNIYHKLLVFIVWV